MKKICQAFCKAYPSSPISYGFLEYCQPDLQAGLATLMKKQPKRVVAVQVFLFTGVHQNCDIPEFLDQARQTYPDTEFIQTSHLGPCDELCNLGLKRLHEIKETENIPANSTVLFLGVGSSVKEANVDIRKLADAIAEKSPFKNGQLAFASPKANPSPAALIESLETVPERLIVLPLLFFDGAYIQGVMKKLKAHPRLKDSQVFFAKPFGSDQLVVDALIKQCELAQADESG